MSESEDPRPCDPLIEAICQRLGCGGDSIMNVLDQWEDRLVDADQLHRIIAFVSSENGSQVDRVLALDRMVRRWRSLYDRLREENKRLRREIEALRG